MKEKIKDVAMIAAVLLGGVLCVYFGYTYVLPLIWETIKLKAKWLLVLLVALPVIWIVEDMFKANKKPAENAEQQQTPAA